MKYSQLLILLASVSLTACQKNIDSPKQVAEKYWLALKQGDSAAAHLLTAKNTQADLERYLALPDESKISPDDIKLGNEIASVPTTLANQIEFDTILVLENGEWKIDASQTQLPVAPIQADPSNDNQISESLQKNLDSMDEALEEGADMLNEFMQEGSREMSESLLKGMNKMNESLREAIEKMKQRREQQESTPPPENKKGEGLI